MIEARKLFGLLKRSSMKVRHLQRSKRLKKPFMNSKRPLFTNTSKAKLELWNRRQKKESKEPKTTVEECSNITPVYGYVLEVENHFVEVEVKGNPGKVICTQYNLHSYSL